MNPLRDMRAGLRDVPVSGVDPDALLGTLRSAIREAWRKGVQVCRLIIGIPDYDTYVEHIRRSHPERVPMTYEEFFIERQNARYKGGGGRCC